MPHREGLSQREESKPVDRSGAQLCVTDEGAECIPFGEGPFQMWVLFSTAVGGGIAFLQNILFTLMLREMDHWCKRPEEFSQTTVDAWKLLAIPRYPNGSYSRCTVRSPPHGGASARVVTCNAWEFDLREYGNNVVSEWSLVCRRSYLRDVCVFVSVAAMVLSLPVAGTAADLMGRKTVALVALTGLLVTLLGTSVALDFQAYLMTRVVVAGTSRVLFVLFVVLYEVTTESRRLLYCTLAPAISTIIGPIFELIVDTYKIGWSASHLLVALLGVLLLATFYVLEESPVWLLAMNNKKGAKRAALRAASMNGVPSTACTEDFKSELRRRRRLTGEKSPLSASLGKRTALCAFVWFVLCWAHSHYSSGRGLAVDRYVQIGATLSLGPVFLVVSQFVKCGRRVNRAVATSLAVFSVLSALLFYVRTCSRRYCGPSCSWRCACRSTCL
ncbi:hypothetical protein HPB48_009793 [Haemaphysalis longicornis]|uniref:Organic cation/carnitine transporter n=1 Tax=Haemaphysalis longicornis TaxID=44386 RepID=A0A9J6H4Q8_HAELO|nr:hypothetical protein HPB48_009793 [Haemaphysalis longicornis]